MNAEPLCPSYRALVERRLDGELGAKEDEWLRSHLEQCPGCRREVEDHELLAALARRLPREAPPVDLVLAVRRRIAAGEPGQRAGLTGEARGRGIRDLLPWAAALLLLAAAWRVGPLAPVAPWADRLARQVVQLPDPGAIVPRVGAVRGAAAATREAASGLAERFLRRPASGGTGPLSPAEVVLLVVVLVGFNGWAARRRAALGKELQG